jgi:hypothetical protein
MLCALVACNAAPIASETPPELSATRASISEAKASLVGAWTGGEVIAKKVLKGYNDLIKAINIDETALPLARAELRALGTELSSRTLPRGDFNCEDPKACTMLPNSDLIIRFRTVEGLLGELKVDWDGSSRGEPSESVWVNTSSTTRMELPTKMFLTLEAIGLRFAELELTASWENPVLSSAQSGGEERKTFAVGLSSLSFRGFARDSKTKFIDVKNFHYEARANTIQTSGDIGLNLTGDQVKLIWQGATNGAVSNDASDFPILIGSSALPFGLGLYIPAGFRPTGMAVATARLEINKRPYEAFVKLKNWTYNLSSTPQAVDVLEGSFANLERKSVLFFGRLDDANQNCVIGDALNVEGRGETKMLESILMGGGVYSCKPEARGSLLPTR